MDKEQFATNASRVLFTNKNLLFFIWVTGFESRTSTFVCIISRAKRWWQQLRVVNIVWISMTRKAPVSFGPAAICSGFDLSCCCVALQVQIDMTSQILCHYGSGHDLAKGTMYLLPCSFYNDVALQMLRVLKYLHRGFKLVGVAKDDHVCTLY